MKRLLSLVGGLLLVVALAAPAAAHEHRSTGRGTGPVVYVPGQGVAYDSIVLTELPANGPFQKLEMGGPTGLYTEFGPGDPGYLGGRWWVDVNGDGIQNEGDAFFLCPLLGPGFVPST